MQGVFETNFKERLAAGEKVAGCWAQLVSPIAAEAMAMQGYDWVLVDMEHAPNDFSTLLLQVMAINGRGVPAVVRAPWNDFVQIKRILDTGVQGVLIPYVNTAEEAAAAVRACKYPPEGIRGIAGSHRAGGYGRDAKGYAAQANSRLLIITQIETGTALDNLDEMLRVDGVDGFFIGPMDLATNLGHLADPSHPEVQEAIREVERKVTAAGKILGTLTSEWSKARELYEKGYQLVTLLSDVTTVTRVAAEQIEAFRKWKERES